MNRNTKLAFAAAVVLMAVGAFFLARAGAFQKLGPPGVQVVAHRVMGEGGVLVGTNAIDLPDQVLDFSSQEQPVAKVVFDWLPKDTTYGQRIYEAKDGYWVAVNAVLMGTDRTSIHKPEYCLAGQGFQRVRMEQTTVSIAAPHRYDLPVQKWTLTREVALKDGTKARQHALFVFWFVADGQMTAEHNQRMWWMARDLVTRGTLQRWAYISCFSAFPEGREAATWARMQEFIVASVPRFQKTTGPGQSAGQHAMRQSQ